MIELRGLTKVFGRARAVDDLTCSIEPGVVTGFLWWGPLGALVYFTGVVAAVFLAGVSVINRCDP